MEKKEPKKLLLPLDGSKRSLDTVRHFAAIKPFQRHDVVLLHVFTSVPDCYWDLAKEPKSIKVASNVKAWEMEQRKSVEKAMDRARRLLLQAGFDKASIKVLIRNRKRGIARDIVSEARNGYGAVIIRRRGGGAVRSMVLGSVASKLIQSVSFTPVLILGKGRPGGKIMVAMDGSKGAMQALDFVATHLGGFDYDVRLAHVIRASRSSTGKPNHLGISGAHSKTAHEMISAVFSEARNRLIAGGFSQNQISEAVISGALSRAGALAKSAKEEGFDTIVIGRRGISRPRPFAIGGVSNKVIHMARQYSVWVINGDGS